MEAAVGFGIRRWVAACGCAVVALLLVSPAARAGIVTDGVPTDGGCPPIADKPGQVDHDEYGGEAQHITYCYGPITIQPGQNIIRLRAAKDSNGTPLWPQEPGYITRFDPEFIYADGTVPPVDVLHLHHAVWLVNPTGPDPGGPQFAVGEEKTIQQLPHGFGWHSEPDDDWTLNDMLHDLVARPAQVYVVWRIDFVPDDSPAADDIRPVRTQWMDVAGQSLYPVFDSLRKYGQNGTYTFPDQAPASDLQPCSLFGGSGSGDRHGCLGGAQTWKVPAGHPQTLIATAGHLHPGGLYTSLTDTRDGHTNTLFTSRAHYYEPAGEVSWDVTMGGSPAAWRVQVEPGDKVSVHATYDTTRADWYEVMGIMPVAVYDGVLPDDDSVKDAQDPTLSQTQDVPTHEHLAENNHHGGEPTGAPDPFALPSVPAPNDTVNIQQFAYRGNPNAGPSVPTIEPGQSLAFRSLDSAPSVNAFHTITACKEPCTGATGIAYPIANGPVTFDSGELGFNGNQGAVGNAPAADRDTWQTPKDLPAGTYTYFCRIHPFMRGAFRVETFQKLSAKKRQRLAKAAVKVTLDRPGKVRIRARVKGAKGKGRASALAVVSRAIDSKRSTKSIPANVKRKIRLKFSRSARQRISAALAGKGAMRVIVTSTASDRWGKTSTVKTGFKLVG